MRQTSASPVSFEVSVRRLPSGGLPVRFEADAEQRAALAAVHDLLSVERFAVDLVVRTWKRDGVRVSGRVTGSLVQACVVTLEPVPQEIDEPVEAVFVPEGSKLARPAHDSAGEMLLSADGPDAPETFSGDTVDVGQLAEEFFALAIDPYPRSAGSAGAAEAAGGTSEADPSASPFARLKGLGSRP